MNLSGYRQLLCADVLPRPHLWIMRCSQPGCLAASSARTYDEAAQGLADHLTKVHCEPVMKEQA